MLHKPSTKDSSNRGYFIVDFVDRANEIEETTYVDIGDYTKGNGELSDYLGIIKTQLVVLPF